MNNNNKSSNISVLPAETIQKVNEDSFPNSVESTEYIERMLTHFLGDLSSRIITSQQLSTARLDAFEKNFYDVFDTLKHQINEQNKCIDELRNSVNAVTANQKILNDCQREILEAVNAIISSNGKESKLVPYIQKLSEHQEAMEKLLHGMEEKTNDIHYNVINGSSGTDSQNNSDYVRYLQEQVERLHNDTYLKFMRKYIIDTYISLYSNLSYRRFDTTVEVCKEIEITLGRMRTELESIGIRLYSSPNGASFNAKTMINKRECSVHTPDDKQDVKNSICKSLLPAFYWTIPVENSSSNLHLLQKEEVALYI
ncbi:MAG: hypothetical protein MJZ41_05135 [Bacteroidaceae bacterium]|nr:hypothetical protein [Bacteroidaceae bacterium]